MFEAHLSQGLMLKKLLEAIKELVTDANFDCSETGIALQAMDNSHVALISLLLSSEIFATYRCDRGFSLGVNLTSLNKLLRCAGNDDSITLKADDNSPETLSMSFSAPKHLSIPETEYHAIVSLPSAEFQRVCRDMMVIGETVTIEIDCDEIRFVTEGELGNGNIKLKPTSPMDKPEETIEIIVKKPVSLQFSLKYLMNFTKGSPLSEHVRLCLSEEMPLLVEYTINSTCSFLRYYLAPKIGE
ncbi:749_t:CDS:2 [Entrophospora sp. SA101]|nr:5576_t:CDS:2 [Entrophospora sp. SA101]CAJ0634098.1 749_t:CDS:2 [Entrophospora sp. SA101]CAJ0831278.1 14976_t:CDS:2 [Entrophospora sp. SA101]CAJ0903890.1 13863_t:CDS:2 [Entrophospora sp. SA101]CAJ0910723.1 9547_t:CDS:2 [Entrophospora sp. SA101]